MLNMVINAALGTCMSEVVVQCSHLMVAKIYKYMQDKIVTKCINQWIERYSATNTKVN